MEFGIFTDFHIRKGMTYEDAFDESFAEVDAAEKLGIDCIWLAEHHFQPNDSVLASPLVVASAIATRTSRMRIGLGVQVLPLANPLRVAEEAATVDHISKGRLDFGVGRSGLTKFYQGFNVDYSESRGRFYEALDIIMKAWKEEEFSYEGEFYSYHNVTVVPKPYQKPHPVIRVAAESADTFSKVGSLGQAIFVHANNPDPLPQLKERLALYKKARQEAGHPGPGDVVLRIPTYVAETTEKARSEAEASTIHRVQGGVEQRIASAASQEVADRLRRLSSLSYDDILDHMVVYGTPEYVTERFQEYQEELGISGVVLDVNYGSQIPPDKVVNSVRLLCEKVLPKFK